MERYITDNLMDGENILWTGRPKNIKLMDNGGSTIIKWIIALLLLIAIPFYSGYANTKAIGFDRILMVDIVFIIVAAVLFCEPLFTFWKLKNKCLYCVTNKRAIICRSFGTITMTFRMLEDVSDVSYDTLKNKCGIVYVGEKGEGSKKRAIEQSVAKESSRESAGKLPLMFYSIGEADVLCALIVKCMSDKTGNLNGQTENVDI